MTPKIAIIGNGGHARVVEATITANGLTAAGFIAEPGHGKPECNIIGQDENLADLAKAGTATHFIVGIGMVKGGAHLRSKLFYTALEAGLEPATLIHPASIVDPTAIIGPGSICMMGSAIQAHAKIGQNVIINTSATVDHDCVIEDNVHIATGATLSGGISVGENSLIGVGSCVRQGLTIGSGVTIGAGAVVVTDVPDNATYVGNPARPL